MSIHFTNETTVCLNAPEYANGVFKDAKNRNIYDGIANTYVPLLMTNNLQKAHRTLDNAIMKLYGFPVRKDFTEADFVAALMGMYGRCTK